MSRYSRKIFVGGLPHDTDDYDIINSFRKFGPFVIEWPHKSKLSNIQPKGYAFLLFQEECSIKLLIESCSIKKDELYIRLSSASIKNKLVHVRLWCLTNSNYLLNADVHMDRRKTVFVAGVPRTFKASDLALLMDRLYGSVCHAAIDVDIKCKYPKGAGRVTFFKQKCYIAALSVRFVQLQHNGVDKHMEIKPYLLNDQYCDGCNGHLCGDEYAPFFCSNITCLKYYCGQCWGIVHSTFDGEFHKPLVTKRSKCPRNVPLARC